MPLRIGCIVGEISGDKLASGLFRALQKQFSNCTIEGIVGPELKALGATVLFEMEALSVMGFIEPLTRLPSLLRIRKTILKHFIQNPPDLFIGVDAPDFNLGIEKVLRSKGIKTVHYVSPTVWAWRKNRLYTIKKSVDLMLTLFPFETTFYHQHNIPVHFVGHPFADDIPLKIDVSAARQALHLSAQKKVVSLLPGSRYREIKNLAKPFLLAAELCYKQNP